MKRGLLIFIVSLLLLNCGGKEKLYIYNWTYYTPESVVKQFEREFNVKVIYDEFASNEDMFAKLKSGGGRYDIVFPSEDYVDIMIKEKMLLQLDHSLLPNLVHIDPAVRKLIVYDTALQYSVPYYYGAAGITVNTEKVPNFERSWSIFGREDLRGKMTLLDDVRETMGGALIYLGYSVNTINEREVLEARDLIVNQWRPNLLKFDAESFGKLYAMGDIWVVHGYPETVMEEIAEDPKLLANSVFFFPKEGITSYIDSMVILKDARNIRLAHQFINFIHRPEIYAEFCDIFGFPATVNASARQYKKGNQWYSMEDLIHTELKLNLNEHIAAYHDAWFESIRVSH